MFGSGREALLEVREWSVVVSSFDTTLPNIQEWSGGPPGSLGEVGRLSLMFGSGQEALLEVREWSVVVSSFDTTLLNIQE